jgi:hypothetical protein
MGLPTTATGPTNVYYLIDDYGTTAGPPGGQTGGASGNMISPEFTAPSLGVATTVAFIFSTAFQRPVRLVTKYGGTPPWTLVTGQAATVALTGVPSGVGY